MWQIQFTHEPAFESVEGSKRIFMLLADWAVIINGDVLTIPAGTATDFATIPQLMQFAIANDDPRILKPSILHDYLCVMFGDIWADRRAAYSSIQAAEILRDAMAVCGADPIIRQAVYLAVRYEGPQWGLNGYTLGAALTPRSPQWRATRKRHLLIEGWCRACGHTENLEVHHIEPFHRDPSRELDPQNLITLCENESRRCHLMRGHLGDWRLINPLVRHQCRAPILVI